PTMLWIILSGALHNFNMYAVNSFLTAFLIRYHRLDLKQASFTSAVVLGAVGVIGLLGGGWASDRLSKSRPHGRLLVASASMLVAGAAVMSEQFKGAGLHHAMYLIPALCLVLAAVLFAAARAMPADAERLRRWMRESSAT